MIIKWLTHEEKRATEVAKRALQIHRFIASAVCVLNFVVYKFSWVSWYSLIHKNLYTMKINTYHTQQRLYLPCRHGHEN